MIIEELTSSVSPDFLFNIILFLVFILFCCAAYSLRRKS